MAGKGVVGWKVSTGVFVAEDRIVLTTVSATPMGTKRLSSLDQPFDGAEVGQVIERLREGGYFKGRLVFGIDPRQLYAITLKLNVDEANRLPAELLAGRLGLSVDALVAVKETIKLPGGMYAVLTACKRSAAAPIVEGLGRKQLGTACLAPATWALHEAAARLKRRARKVKTELRILPGEDTGMVMLTHNGTLVATRLFGMGSEGNVNTISLAVLSLATHAREELGLASIDSVLLHAGETSESLRAECEDAYGLPTVLVPSLTTDSDSISLALAHVGVHSGGTDADLLGELRPSAGFRKIFPVRAAAMLLAVLGGAAFMLNSETERLERDTDKLRRITQKYAQKAKINVKDLKKLHGVLKAEFDIAHAFIAKRVFWSDMLRNLPDVLPSTCTIMDLEALDSIRYPRKKSRRSTTSLRKLMIAVIVPLDAADTSPPEVETFTARLRQSDYFQAEFPRITGATLRLMPAVKGLAARIVVTLYPKSSS
jgi:Tfp pilus assembly protein PilN